MKMFQTIDMFANQDHFQDFVRDLLAAADERISVAGYDRSDSGLQVAACRQISQAAKAYLEEELSTEDFLSILAAFAPLSGL